MGNERHLPSFLFSVIFVIALCSGYISGATINVCPSASTGCAYTDISSAISAASSGDTISLADGQYSLSLISISKNLTIIGSSQDGVIITPSADTSSNNDSRAWILVSSGSSVSFSQLTLDGSSHSIYEAIRFDGTGSVSDVSFKNILSSSGSSSDEGTAISALGGDVSVSDCTFSNIGRVGILYTGSGITSASVASGNTYTGKGAGSWLDYGIGAQSGASPTLTDNAITNCMGSTGGYISAAIAVDNVNGTSSSNVVASENSLSDNTKGAAINPGSASVAFNASSNYWGSDEFPVVRANYSSGVTLDTYYTCQEKNAGCVNGVLQSAASITTPNRVYEVSNSISGTDGTAITISADNVTIDGNGNEIFGSVVNYGNGVTVQNLNIDPEYGFIQYGNNSIISGNTLSNISKVGIWVVGNNNTFTNNSINTTLSAPGVVGIFFDGGQNNQVDCQNNSILGNGNSGSYGLYDNGASNTIQNCQISGFATSAYLASSNSALSGNVISSTLSNANGIVLSPNPVNVINNSNLVMWLDAADASTLTNDSSGSVSEWADKSGHGNNALQSNSSNQAVLSSTGFGGKPTLTFDGSNDYYTLSTQTNLGKAQTIFFVGKNTQSISVVVGSDSPLSNFNFDASQFTFNAQGSYVQISGATQNENIITTVIRDGTSVSAYLNGTLQGNSTLNGANSNWYLRFVGTRGDGTPYPYGGQYSEVLVYNRVLNTGERMAVERYLENKWAPDQDPTNTAISSNSISLSGSNAIAFSAKAAQNSILINNTISANASFGTGLFFDSGSSDNIVYYNTFLQGLYFINNAGSGNQFNTTGPGGKAQGNSYANIMDLLLVDSDADGYGDMGPQYPYNATNAGGKWAGAGADFGPQTTKTPRDLIINLSACQNLTMTEGTYVLVTDLSLSGTCFNILADNITLDCKGHSISGINVISNNDYFGVHGVYSNSSYSTIRNCVISGYNSGVYLAADWAVLSNDTLYNNTYGVSVFWANHALISNSTAYNNSQVGFLAQGDYNLLENNTAFSNGDSRGGYGFYSGGNHNTLDGNTAFNHTAGSPSFYLSGGSSQTLSNNTAYGSYEGFSIRAPNSGLVMANNSAYDTSSYGMLFSGISNMSISGNKLGRTYGMNLYSVSDSVFSGNEISDGRYGFEETAASGNRFEGNTLLNCSSTCIYTGADTVNNTFLHNNIRGPVWVHDESGLNYYNDSDSGNSYYLTNGTGSWEAFDIIDTNSDGWADTGSSRPFGSATVGGNWMGYGQDWFPYTTNTPTPTPTTNLTTCSNLSTANTNYVVVQNIYLAGGTCFNVTAANVMLDCVGFTITGNNSTSTRGVYSSQPSTTVKNCVINNFATGIMINGSGSANLANNTISLTYTTTCSVLGACVGISFIGAQNSTVQNNRVNSYQYAMSIYSASNSNIVSSNSFAASNYYAINIQNNSINNSVSGNNAFASFYAISLQTTSSNNVSNNNATASSQFAIYLTASSNNIIQYNRATAPSGYVISLYSNSNNNTIRYNNATTTSAYAFFLSSSINNTISGNIATALNYALFLTASSNNTIQHNNLTTTGGFALFLASNSDGNNFSYNNASSGNNAVVLTSSANNDVSYNNISSATNGAIVFSTDSHDNTLSYNNASASGHQSLYLISSSNNSIFQNRLSSSSNANNIGSVYLASNSNNNNFTSNLINETNTTADAERSIYINSGANNIFFNNTILSASASSTPAIQIAVTSGNSTFYQNNITSSIWVNDSSGTNRYNSSGIGNIYYFSNGTGSWQVFDISSSTSSNWADQGTGRPFNATTVGGNWTGYGQDWFPYTTNTAP